MDYQSSIWSLVPYVYLRPEDYVDIPFEVLLKHPLAKQIRPQYIDLFTRINGKDVHKFVLYLNRIQQSVIFDHPIEMPRFMTTTSVMMDENNNCVSYPSSTLAIPDSEYYANPVLPIQVYERRSFFHYSRRLGHFFIETYVTMYDTHLYYDEIVVYDDPNVVSIADNVNTTPLRDIVFHWQIVQYNQYCCHTKVPIGNYDFSTNADIFLVNTQDYVQELTYGHYDLCIKLLNEHSRLSKMDKKSFEAERLRMISVLTSDSISNMRTLYQGTNLRVVYDNLVETRLEPLLDESEDLDDDAWAWGDIDITDFPPTAPW